MADEEKKVLYRITQTRIRNYDESQEPPEHPEPNRVTRLWQGNRDEGYGERMSKNPVWYTGAYCPETELDGWISNSYKLEWWDGSNWRYVCEVEPRDPDKIGRDEQ